MNEKIRNRRNQKLLRNIFVFRNFCQPKRKTNNRMKSSNKTVLVKAYFQFSSGNPLDAPKTFKPKTPKSDLRRSSSIKGNSSITLSGSSTDGIAMKNVMAKLTSIDQRLDALDAKMDELKTLFSTTSSNRGRKSIMNIRLTKSQVLAYKL